MPAWIYRDANTGPLTAATSATPAVLMPEEPPAAALGVLIGYDSLEHLNDCDQEVLRNRARMRWTALREACKAPAPGAATS